MYALSNPIDSGLGDPSGRILNSLWLRVLSAAYSFVGRSVTAFIPTAKIAELNNIKAALKKLGNSFSLYALMK